MEFTTIFWGSLSPIVCPVWRPLDPVDWKTAQCVQQCLGNLGKIFRYVSWGLIGFAVGLPTLGGILFVATAYTKFRRHVPSWTTALRVVVQRPDSLQTRRDRATEFAKVLGRQIVNLDPDVEWLGHPRFAAQTRDLWAMQGALDYFGQTGTMDHLDDSRCSPQTVFAGVVQNAADSRFVQILNELIADRAKPLPRLLTQIHPLIKTMQDIQLFLITNFPELGN